MTYYFYMDDVPKEMCEFDLGTLGETTKSTFYANTGFILFNKIIEEFPELSDEIHIIDDNNKEYTIHEFLDKISKLNLKLD